MMRFNIKLSQLPKLFMLCWVMAIFMLQGGTLAQSGDSTTFFLVGTGYIDVTPRQFIRTANDRAYIFAGQAQYTTDIVAYWTPSAGLPNNGAFSGQALTSVDSDPFSVDAVYDGANTVHVLVNTRGGKLYDIPFDTTTNTFKARITVASNMGSIQGDYIGTGGMSGLFDTAGTLHIAYWTNNNHIVHLGLSYNASNNSLNEVIAPTQLDTQGSANHPVLAISPQDGSVTVAWVSESSNPVRILSRTRASSGNWGNEEVVSSAPVWFSTSGGLNIDQGPSLVIGTDGTRHLTYIEDSDQTGDYGRVHYVSRVVGGNWVDQALNTYSHDPSVAITNTNQLYIIGHGPNNGGQNTNLYYSKRQTNGSWSGIQLIASSNQMDFDGSPSVKWSVVGFNRPDVIEFAFFGTDEGNYNNPRVLYGRIQPQGGTSPTSTPIPPTANLTPTRPPPTVTPTNTFTPIPPTMTPVPPSITPTNTTTAIPPTLTPVLPTETGVPPSLTPTEVVPPTATVLPPSGPTLKVDVIPQRANPGDTINVMLNVLQVNNLYGLQVQCTVDPQILSGVAHVESDGFNASNGFFADAGFKPDGSWLVGATRLRPAPAIAGDVVAFGLQYTVVNSGSTTITCLAEAADPSGFSIPLTVVNGVFNADTPIPTSPPPTETPIPPTATPVEPTPTAPPTSLSVIQGNVAYQQATDNSGISVQLLSNGAPLAQVTTLADGYFVFTDVPVGDYVVAVVAPQHLAIGYNVTVSSDGSVIDLAQGILPAGDTDGNQIVDLSDASFVGANFTISVPPAPANADLNRDGLVNIVDLVLIGGNFGKSGPVMLQ